MRVRFCRGTRGRSHMKRMARQFQMPARSGCREDSTPAGFTNQSIQARTLPVAGLGLSAIRDFVSYLKYGGFDSPLRDHPETEKVVLGYGYSQSAPLSAPVSLSRIQRRRAWTAGL